MGGLVLMRPLYAQHGCAAKADKVTRAQIARLHAKLRATPFQANRMLAVVGSIYAFAGRTGAVPEE
jgi:hypothetical protein